MNPFIVLIRLLAACLISMTVGMILGAALPPMLAFPIIIMFGLLLGYHAVDGALR